jgi:uncharacterized protein (TIGR02452 family)
MSLAGIGKETLEIFARGHYDSAAGARVQLGALLDDARAGTALYTPEQVAALAPSFAARETAVEVTPESTTAAGLRLLREGADDVCLLNFASARNVGGGFLRGARAQEEELCRGSGLFRCLETQPAYYAANRAQRSAIYTDHLIYAPRVPFIRDETRALLDEPKLLSVITSPAPNTGAVRNNRPGDLEKIPEAFYRRADQILAVAAERGHANLVLGAWGCGAFQGDPALAADAFGRALEGRFAGAFARVVFAVLVKSKKDPANLAAFGARFPTRG